MKQIIFIFVFALFTYSALTAESYVTNPPIEQLTVNGENFVNASGKTVRFWGINVVALYPTHKTAEGFAENIASYGFNLVRPHHMMRSSLDWNHKSQIAALVDYRNGPNTYTFDKEALDRFDYLNAQLRKKGIYLAFALRWSRQYKPEDVDILQTTPEDKKAWMQAMDELNKWHWQKSHDVKKMLPMVDERVFKIEQTFTRKLLTHVNPYTGIAYGKDHQVLMLEIINEFSSEYALICGNRFPEYWNKKLQAKWSAFLKENNGGECDLYKPQTPQQKKIRADFFRKLDTDYYSSMKKLLTEIGCNTPTTFSNLWRGERDAKMHAEMSRVVENHTYSDPFVVGNKDDLFLSQSRKQLLDKPYFVGELNQAEGAKNIRRQGKYRTMLPLAVSTYGSLQNWSGVEWFAWQHGDRILQDNGLPEEMSLSRDRGRIGELMADGMMLDHMRTCGIIFKKLLAAPSVTPVIVNVDEPMSATNYEELMKPKYLPQPGWQSIHGIRKTFSKATDAKQPVDVFNEPAPDVLISDTNEIIKDTKRQQLILSAPQAEALSGWLDGGDRTELKHLKITGKDLFTTTVLVSLDNKPIAQSHHLLISRTAIDKDNQEVSKLPVVIKGLAKGNWQIRLTRPEATRHLLSDYAKVDSVPASFHNGALMMPEIDWHECEIEIK